MNILDRVKKGEILDDIEIYDSHAHLGKWYCITMRESEAQNLVDIMDRMHFKRMAISSSLAICCDFKKGNDCMVKALANHPGRFFGYITLNANYKDGLIDEVLRLEEQKDVIGLKIHPAYSGVNVTDERYQECFTYAGQKKMAVLVHTFNRGDVSLLGKMIEKYPDVNFIIAHCGAEDGVELTAEFLKQYPNAYCDLPVSFAPHNTVEYIVHNGDENKIFFGTDAPLFDYRITYGRVLFADISDEAKRKIMGLNFKKCIGLPEKD